MEENEKEVKNEEQKTIDTEELKKEAANTMGQVKDTMKDLRIKDETMNATNFVKEMVKDPLSKTEEIAKDTDNKYLKTSIFMIIVWMVARFINSAVYYGKYSFSGRNFLSILKSILSPLCIVLALTFIIFILNKKRKKSLTTVLSTVVTAYIPMCIASIVNLLNLISYKMSDITTPISTLAKILTIILSYFAVKDVFEEETELGTFKKFVLVELIYLGVALVISFLGISMYI